MCLVTCIAAALVFTGSTRANPSNDQTSPRLQVDLNSGWRTIQQFSPFSDSGFEQPGFDDRAWKLVDVPHNWDDYHGFHQVKHGNLHGSAWYRRWFTLDRAVRGKRVFLMFEGVGSYASVWLNGRFIARHTGGRTSFTVDITDAAAPGAANLLAVRADHPAGIQDLPWVCGGCDFRLGFSEGSQPLGIFRPVQLIVTSPLRIEPFGVHIWNDANLSATSAVVHVETELRNYGAHPRHAMLENWFSNSSGRRVAGAQRSISMGPGEKRTFRHTVQLLDPHLWSLEHPHLYRVQTQIRDIGSVLDEVETAYGLRWIEWPEPGSTNGQFRLNGKPVFINGTCEYEHLLGGSHAFSEEQIRARVGQFRAAGFNAFRDAHQPHNLRYQEHWQQLGILWWPQFSAQIWFDTPEFRENFKMLLRDWVKERRNNPANVLWGIQNESKLPEPFVRECLEIIRELDPTASTQRKITSCNGGAGFDWNVPQNWSGTYGGKPDGYAAEAVRQQLIGEYGGVRSLEYHTEGPFDLANDQPRIASEDRFAALMETKIRLGESVRDRFCGQFQWLLSTHDNPGRSVENCWDGIRELDQVGVVNNKGLLTSWGEPVDAFYLYRANYAPPQSEPMVYIVSHTWPGRWPAPGNKSGIVVYSNCERVELFNDYQARSLGAKTHGGKGTHFQWDDADIRYNLLYAEGSIGGRVVATDVIRLHHLPEAPHAADLDPNPANVTRPEPGQHYLYRVNCGGPEYTDANGNTWLADRMLEPGDAWGSTSWAARFADVPPQFASRRKISDPIAGTRDDPLFQTYRYGRHELAYRFALPDGLYRVELYFVEPWYGRGGGLDCTGWRLFDVAVNDEVLLRDVDIWKEAGYARALKKVVTAAAKDGELRIGFPRVPAYQAVLSAIAIATSNPDTHRPALPPPLVTRLTVSDTTNAPGWSSQACLDEGDTLHADASGTITALPPKLDGADWLRTPQASHGFTGPELARFDVTKDAEVYVACDSRSPSPPAWLADWLDLDQFIESNRGSGRLRLYRKTFLAGSTVVLGDNAVGLADPDMYTVIVKRAWPPPPPRIIRDFSVTGAADPAAWRAVGKLRPGDLQYSDANRVFTVMGQSVTGGDWVRAPMRCSGSERLRIRLNDSADVYVALNAATTPVPAWLSDWIKTTRVFSNSDRESASYVLYKRRYSSRGMVDLGGLGEAASRGAPMYTVIVSEGRPSTVYPAGEARLSGARLAAPVAGGEQAVRFDQAGGATAEWTITVGAGDIYGLKFGYRMDRRVAVPMKLEVVNTEGNVLSTKEIEFAPVSEPGGPGELQANTGVRINAGTYTVRLTTIGVGGPELTSLEVE